MSWTDPRVETLTSLWRSGRSASQIAAELGGVTRNAVIGKVHRLGLDARAKPSRPKSPKMMRPPHQQRPARPEGVHHPISTNPSADMNRLAPRPAHTPAHERPGCATLLTLTSRTCRWPIGDPTDIAFTFCGRTTSTHPYCVEHSRVAFPPRLNRKRATKA